MKVIIIWNGPAIEAVLPEAPTLPPNGERVEADAAMLRRVDSFAFLSVVGGQLVLDQAAQDAVRTAREAAVVELARDLNYQQLYTNLRDATPAQIASWVDAQVTDLASARTMFKRILILLAYQLRR